MQKIKTPQGTDSGVGDVEEKRFVEGLGFSRAVEPPRYPGL
jgi:hypothetical protein